jgi:hypothetical protein
VFLANTCRGRVYYCIRVEKSVIEYTTVGCGNKANGAAFVTNVPQPQCKRSAALDTRSGMWDDDGVEIEADRGLD